MSESYAGDGQANQFKLWWNKVGKLFVGVVMIAILCTVGVRMWNNHVEQRRIAASNLYDTYQQGLLKHQTEMTDAAFAKLRKDYPDSPYATAVSMLAAAQDVAKNENDKALAELQWVMDHGHSYAKPLARLRAAQLKTQSLAYDEALALLDQANVGTYQSAYDELAGDILIQKGDVNAAIQRYQKALELYKAQGFDNMLLNFKLQTYAPTQATGEK